MKADSSQYWEPPFSQPYFDNLTRRDVTTTVGQTAHLHCRVRNLGDRAVSRKLFTFVSVFVSEKVDNANEIFYYTLFR